MAIMAIAYLQLSKDQTDASRRDQIHIKNSDITATNYLAIWRRTYV